MEGYALSLETPSVGDYCRLRRVSGLVPRSMAAARAGLPNTAAGVVVRRDGEAVGMGRAVGAGLVYLIVDVAVGPAHQGRGLGNAIMAALMDRLREVAPAEAYVGLFANGDAHRLYARFGFTPAAPATPGMETWIGEPPGA